MQVRQFLWDEIGLKGLYRGDGLTYDDDGRAAQPPTSDHVCGTLKMCCWPSISTHVTSSSAHEAALCPWPTAELAKPAAGVVMCSCSASLSLSAPATWPTQLPSRPSPMSSTLPVSATYDACSEFGFGLGLG